MEGTTYYEILGISPKSTREEIRAAYHKLIKTVHPDKDKSKNDRSQVYVKNLNKAYEVLKNPQKRREYDNSIKNVKKSDSDFKMMKDEARAFFKTLEVSEEELQKLKEKAKQEFEQKSKEMDMKRGINRDTMNPVNMEEMDGSLAQLEMLREQEYIENMPIKIVDPDDENFVTRFNDTFDSIAAEADGLIKYTGETLPYNEINESLIEDVEDQPSVFLNDYSKRRVDSIIGTVQKRTTEPPKTVEDLEKLMQERLAETENLHNMKMYDFNTEKCFNASGRIENAEGWLELPTENLISSIKVCHKLQSINSPTDL